MIEKFNKMANSKKILIAIITAVVLIVLIILFAVFRNNGYSYEVIKEDDSKDLVYTIKSTENDIFHIYIPYVNIKDSSIKEINEDINSYVDDYMDKEMVILSYEYNVNGKVLSLAIKTVDYDNEDYPLVYFKTYNINLETKKLVSDSEMLDAFDINANDVNSAIEKQFKNWYNDLVKEEYFSKSTCDYDCFLEYRGVENYMDEIAYYIDNGKLIVFKPFSFYSIYKEEEYFKEDDFKIIIK